MNLRRLVFVAAAVVAAGVCVALLLGVRRPAVAHAAAAPGAPLRELSPVSAGRCTVSWTPANGLSLRWDGVPIVRKSTLYIVKAGWSGLLLDQRTVPVRVTPWNEDAATGAKVAQVTLENNDALAAYTFTLAGDGRTFAVDLANTEAAPAIFAVTLIK